MPPMRTRPKQIQPTTVPASLPVLEPVPLFWFALPPSVASVVSAALVVSPAESPAGAEDGTIGAGLNESPAGAEDGTIGAGLNVPVGAPVGTEVVGEIEGDAVGLVAVGATVMPHSHGSLAASHQGLQWAAWAMLGKMNL